MYQKKYYVPKYFNTQEEALECSGLAFLLNKVFGISTKIINTGAYYEITCEKKITDEMVDEVQYKELIPVIVKDSKSKKEIEEYVLNVIDIQEERSKKETYQKLISKIDEQIKNVRNSDYTQQEKSEKIKRLNEQKEGIEEGPSEFLALGNAMRQMKFLDAQIKIINNVCKDKSNFKQILKWILEIYSDVDSNTDKAEKKYKKYLKNNKEVKFQNVNQLAFLNPTKIKGLNKSKATGISLSGIKGFWIQEYVKLVGVYQSMITRQIKVGNNYDCKVFVLEPNKINLKLLKDLTKEFNKELRGSTSIRLDIKLILQACQKLIHYHENYSDDFYDFIQPRDILKGFYSVYFKNMRKASSPTNISFLQIPSFIKVSSNNVKEWLSLLNEHIKVIDNIKHDYNKQDEKGEVFEILRLYRLFINTEKEEYFYDFTTLYAAFLMKKLSEGKQHLKVFTDKYMEVLIMGLNQNYSEIFESQGFKNIAEAIRQSTVYPQYFKNKKGNESKIKYSIKYGMAQDMKRKSAYKGELIEYLAEFITWYNSQNARAAEKYPNEQIRAMIKEKDLEEVINLIGTYGSNVIGKLLCAYGYTFKRKEEGRELL